MGHHAEERMASGKPMPGIFAVPRKYSVAAMIDEILLVAVASLPDEWEGQIQYLPLK